MPITGRFIADFGSFTDAVKKAEVELRGMETGAGKVGSSLNKMVDQFSGRKVIQEAQLMVQAFELLADKGIGLTTKELQRMGVVAEEAMAKLKAGGEQIPPGLQKIADAAKAVPQELDKAQASAGSFFSTLQKAAGIVGIAFSVGAITRFVGSVFDAASEIKDLSERLGVSTDAVQRFKFAAEQGGGTIDDVGASLQKMNQNLAEGSKDTYAALKLLGLGFEEVRSQSPEDALLTITDRLEGIQDPMQRTRLQMELLGKSSAGLGASIAGGFREVANQADIMEKKSVEDLEKAQQAWENFGNKVTIVTGNIIGEVLRITSSYENLGRFVLGTIVPQPVTNKALTDQQKEQIKNLVAIGNKAKDIAPFFGEASDAALAFAESLAKAPPIIGKTKVETEAATAAAKTLKEQWEAYIAASLKRGDADIKHEKQLAAAIENVNHQMDLYVNKHLKDAGEKGQKVLSDAGDAAVRFGLDMSGLHPVIAGVGKDFMDMSATGIQAARNLPPEIKKSTDALGELTKALSQMATVASGSFSAVASYLATFVSAIDVAKKSADGLSAGFGKMSGESKDVGAGLSEMATSAMGLATAFMQATAKGSTLMKTLSGASLGAQTGFQIGGPLGAAIGAGIGGLAGLIRGVAGNAGRDLVEEFAASMGGFDALQKKLEAMGEASAGLWEKLTQGTGRNNPEEAARNIAEVEAALARQADAQGEVTSATEEQAQATIETASQAAKALEELGPKIKTNEDEWKNWGDVVTAQIQRIADGVRALALPTMPGAAAIGAGAGGGSMAFSNKTTLILDGEVVGESVARQIMKA